MITFISSHHEGERIYQATSRGPERMPRVEYWRGGAIWRESKSMTSRALAYRILEGRSPEQSKTIAAEIERLFLGVRVIDGRSLPARNDKVP